MITIPGWLAFIPLATFLAGLGCCWLLIRPGHRGLDLAYDEGRRDGRAAAVLEEGAAPWCRNCGTWMHYTSECPEVGDGQLEPLVPLVDEDTRLPDADTLTRMYAELGGSDDLLEDPLPVEGQGDAGRGAAEPEEVQRLAGTPVRPALPLPGVQLQPRGLAYDQEQAPATRLTPAQRRRDKHKRRGAYTDPEDTAWDLSEGAERVSTIAELAQRAEFGVWETELAGQIASAWDWFDETFATGQFTAIR